MFRSHDEVLVNSNKYILEFILSNELINMDEFVKPIHAQKVNRLKI